MKIETDKAIDGLTPESTWHVYGISNDGQHQPTEEKQNHDATKEQQTMKTLNEDISTSTPAPGPYDSKPAPKIGKPKPATKGVKPATEVKPKAKKEKKPAAKPAKKSTKIDGVTTGRSEQKDYIWSQLDGSKTKAEIAIKVGEKFGTDMKTALKRVNDAPFYMRKAGLNPIWKESV